MRPPTDSQVDSLHHQLVANGDWERLRTILVAKLNESGWTDRLRTGCAERIQHMDAITFSTLLADMAPQSVASTPPQIKQEMQTVIKQYIAKQVE
jgi:hypothetical protein